MFPMHCRHPNSKSITVGAWNVRTLLENKQSHMKPTAAVARELKEWKIDVCALSETRLHGENKIKEVGARYTFFNGRPTDNPPQIHVVSVLRLFLPVSWQRRAELVHFQTIQISAHLHMWFEPDALPNTHSQVWELLTLKPPNVKTRCRPVIK